MKKLLLSLSVVLAVSGVSYAQSHDGQPTATTTAAPAAAAPASSLKPENLQFNEEIHDFGTVAEGGDINFNFVFKNTGKEPIIVQSVNVSCGCTSPSWSKDPVLPGKKGTIPVTYHTQGRVGQFNKPITVMSNAGTKVITIKGTVEKAPENSVPTNKSMVKMN
ncbi:MAG: DUF1573 domain-containing protein [Bacteroidetes bacterium]|nr:DUF1573 domain-containing protein [Bacteroidota bacterium]